MLEVTCVCACKEGGLEVRRFKAVAREAFNRTDCADLAGCARVRACANQVF